MDEAGATLARLGEVGISLDEVTERLLQDGVRQFAESFAKLLNALDLSRGMGC